ncbi:family 2A encapsulin nanocompartment cargo protein cysteine desulfurase [Nocardia bovistercoris]|uniref:cysteine desulfurase n=1 Tax=Nocardia bovistercoris TaxID=2785916 RepID=A0A931N2I8_9NOCA|nr:family 2A encapsulin nanocompartment cargo protein cysteine desulfurase [Nocardia bovistercoris]MBH0779555.1 SufS family cysteine desulfurase [Nocardia bovistercoris]
MTTHPATGAEPLGAAERAEHAAAAGPLLPDEAAMNRLAAQIFAALPGAPGVAALAPDASAPAPDTSAPSSSHSGGAAPPGGPTPEPTVPGRDAGGAAAPANAVPSSAQAVAVKAYTPEPFVASRSDGNASRPEAQVPATDGSALRSGGYSTVPLGYSPASTRPTDLGAADPMDAIAPVGDSTSFARAFTPPLPAVEDLLPSPHGVPATPLSSISSAPSFYFLEPPAVSAPPSSPFYFLGADTATIAPDPRPPFDVYAVRNDFPILRERVNGHPLVWFDNAATTQKPRAVIDRLAYFYEHENSNIHRAAHELAARSTDAYENARDTVARFLGAGSSEEIIFVRGATEGINLIAQTWGRAHIGEGDEILISHLEHHANIVPWQMLAAERGAVLKVIPVDDSGALLLDEYTRLLSDRTKIVSVTQVSNALGTLTPAAAIVDQAHRAGAIAVIDGAQSVPHTRVDLRSLGADFFVFSGHKLYGPTGIGAVYGRSEVLRDLPPWQGGGNMISDVTLDRSLFQPPPGRFEAGTGNIADAVGLAAAIDYVERIGIENIARYEHDLLEYATPRLAAVPGVRLIGTAPEKASVISFVMAGLEPLEVGKALNEKGIAVRAGHHCAQPILRRFGLEATVRPSFAFYNTCEEIDRMIATLEQLSRTRG